MPSGDYNKYLAAIKAANSFSDKDEAKKQLRAIYQDMVKRFGLMDDDVEYLVKQFRYYID